MSARTQGYVMIAIGAAGLALAACFYFKVWPFNVQDGDATTNGAAPGPDGMQTPPSIGLHDGCTDPSCDQGVKP